MDHTLKTTKNIDLKAEATLTELIDNNKRILENRINKKTIEQLINVLNNNHIEELHAKYVNILRALVNCNNSAIAGNQALIT